MAAALVPSVCHVLQTRHLGKLGQLGFFGSTSSGPPVSLNRTNLGEKDVINHNQMTAAIYCQPLIIKQLKDIKSPSTRSSTQFVPCCHLLPICSYCSCWYPHSSGCRSHGPISLFLSVLLMKVLAKVGIKMNQLGVSNLLPQYIVGG